MLINATTVRTIGDGQINRQPIFYHPEAWNNYKNQTALSRSAAAKTRIGAAPKQGLLYPSRRMGEDTRPRDGTHRQKICNRHSDLHGKHSEENGHQSTAC